MSEERLQNEYNKALESCDVFVMLFFTKVGKFTQEEFDTAYNHFKSSGRPYIYTFFKNAQVAIGELNESDMLSLFGFKKKLKDLGHFYTTYTSIEDLKYQFNQQLHKLIDGGLLNLPLNSELKTQLDKVKTYCKQNNIYIYTANILLALLQNQQGFVSRCLDKTLPGYTNLLRIKLKQVIEEDFIGLKRADPYVEQEWFQRKEFALAADYAQREGCKNVEERHLLRAIIEQQGSTVRMLRKDIGEDRWTMVLSCLQPSNQNDTPITQI